MKEADKQRRVKTIMRGRADHKDEKNLSKMRKRRRGKRGKRKERKERKDRRNLIIMCLCESKGE